jgi:hypothetical protein
MSSSAESHLPPVSARDLINVATAPKRTVTVAVHDASDAVADTIDAARAHAYHRADSHSDYDADPGYQAGWDAGDDGNARIRRVAVRGSQREFADAVSDRVQREFAREVSERYGQRSTTAAAQRGRDWRANPGSARRVSNPFRAGGFSPWGASSAGDYVGRHRAG